MKQWRMSISISSFDVDESEANVHACVGMFVDSVKGVEKGRNE